MLLRGDQCLFNAAFYGVTSALLLSTSTLVAAAADSPAPPAAAVASIAPQIAAATPETRTLPGGIIITGNTVTMAPIPNNGRARHATPAAAPTETVSALQAISLTERPAIIIKDGTVTMLPVGGAAPAGDAAVNDLSTPELDAETASVHGKSSTRGSSEANCLARAIYFEARGESTRGQEAVAQVVLARKRTPGRPKTICGVVYEGSRLSTGCQFSFACDGIPDTINNREAWSRAQRIASIAMSGKLKPVARGATYYHANYVRPYWASSMVKVATIGTHIFYRP